MKRENPLSKLEWQGNSKEMYRAVLNAMPPLFVGSVQRSIINWIVRNNITLVTEDTVFQAVDEIAPPGIAKKIKTGLEKYRTK